MATVNSKDQQYQYSDKLFSSIAKTDKTDSKIGNVFNNKQLNVDYEKALKAKDPNERKSFIEKLITADYFGGEQADKKTDGLVDGKSIFNLKDNNQKANLLNAYNETLRAMGLNRPQENKQIPPAQNIPDQGISNNSFSPDINGLDPFGMGEIRALVSQIFAPRNYSPAEIKDMNSRGVYTAASEMTPEMLKNITEGKVKDIKAGNYGGVKLNDAQVNNAKVIAATIVDVGKKKNQSPQEIHRAVVIALATAMQESTLKNIGYGDRDSVGLFQQRPSCGWGSKEQCQDPVYATRKFADKLYQTDYMNKSVTSAAQNVQRSAFPNAYAKHQPMAEALATALLSA
ncbi:MAG TPA: hypothetical protein DDW90_10770 [Cyanobacteria bacterium UBA9971]|nr:hypothetical protein [Cyanobacteria bacterium UBA9971]